MIVLSRIDSRLIHGQVIEAWVPHLRVSRVVIADDEAAADQLIQAAMAVAVPAGVEMVVKRVADVQYRALASDTVRTMLLFRDVRSAAQARELGLPNGMLNVGNVHAGPGRAAVSVSVFLSAEEKESLQRLRTAGMEVVIQAIPTERPAELAR